MLNLNEELLTAWLRLSQSISNERIVKDLTYNESLISNILYRNQILYPETSLNATDLCKATNILKSQMHCILNNMEKKKLIIRERSTSDKRKIYIQLNPERLKTYEKQHEKILSLVDSIIERLGIQRAQETLNLFNTISNIAQEVL